MGDYLTSIVSVLDLELFRIGHTPVRPSTIAGLLAVIMLTYWTSRVLRKGAERLLAWRGEQPAVIGTVTTLIHYAVLVTGFGVGLSIVGIDLTALFTAGAIFAVGIGFAMQSIAQNFVAGIILLTERAIKPGDILEVEGLAVKLLEMGIRSSVARARDGEDLIIPNATLIQTMVKNFTLKDATYRIRASVGVSYNSDMAVVKSLLTEVAEKVSRRWAVPNHSPQVILTGFGDNAVNWEVAIWMSDPWESRPALSELHEEIWWAFKAKEVVSAFPQVDVHFDPTVFTRLPLPERPRGSAAASP